MRPRPTDGLHPEIDDAERIATFRKFLCETPGGVALLHDLCHAPEYFPDRPAFERWRARWLAYLVGLTDGPTSPAEYAAVRHKIFGRRRAEIEGLDRFHA